MLGVPEASKSPAVVSWLSTAKDGCGMAAGRESTMADVANAGLCFGGATEHMATGTDTFKHG